MKLQVIFVDDEPHVLSGLRRLLHPMREEWEMRFVSSGEEALAELARAPFDVIVSDMRMPGMDGADLLLAVREKYPDMVRIVLSGQSDKESIFRSVGVAHQYLSKPCDADTLLTKINRACALRGFVGRESVKKLISKTESLPSLPRLYTDLLAELKSKDPSIKRVGQIIAQDVAMTAKVLQLVNSAFFGRPRSISSPGQAAVYLGLDTIASLVLSLHVFKQLDRKLPAAFAGERLMHHSLQTGALAKALAAEEKLPKHETDQAFLAGVLHDTGKLILAANFADEYEAVLRLAQTSSLSFIDAEQRIFGATHAEVGAALLGIWGLPDAILEAIAYHHAPVKSFDAGFSPLTAVHVADALNHVLEGNEDATAGRVDMTYLERANLKERMGRWREIAQRTREK